MNNFLKFLFIISTFSATAFSGDGDVRHVISHNKVKVITDPSKGYNTFKKWAEFPSAKTGYRKAVLYVTYQCPDSLHCGEWDYIDNVYLRRVDGVNGASKDIELARLISPYGWRFGSTWHFTWHVDITDFAPLLHDSVEIEFNHSGYEGNTDRGWLITLDFAMTEGKPAMEWAGMDTLWHGSIPYGDTLKSFDQYLPAKTIIGRSGADIARMRIVQTGHGMDDLENCAEFCSKYRQVFFDDSLIDKRQIWRRCGTNPLYPQGGTWIYDRANWCPGSMVIPDVYDVAIAPGSTHSVRMAMEPYLNRKHPTANYYLYSYLIYYKLPHAQNDVSLEEIIAPSTMDEYSRMNPICDNPRILVKNSGRAADTSIIIKYGLSGEHPETYFWQGRLESQKTIEITLPAVLSAKEGNQKFSVALESPNGKDDEYPEDNAGSSMVTIPPVYGNHIVVAIRTNHDSTSNGYQVVDQNGAIVRGHKVGAYRANTIYRDTLDLSAGCYQLVVSDTVGDGLDFWANPEGGFGYVRLLDLKGRLLKSFGSDFGSEISHYFTVADGYEPSSPDSELPIVNLFPIRNPGKFSLEMFFNDIQGNVVVRIDSENSSKKVYEQSYRQVKETIVPIDIATEPDGFYIMKVTAGDKTVTKKFKVKHKG
ncbi:MAG: peptide-N-glycosidase F-related protein [Bacteroidota bacterium]